MSDARPFDPANHILIAADSIDELRRCDLYRVLYEAPEGQVMAVARYIKEHRPDLVEEVDDLLASEISGD